MTSLAAAIALSMMSGQAKPTQQGPIQHKVYVCWVGSYPWNNGDLNGASYSARLVSQWLPGNKTELREVSLARLRATLKDIQRDSGELDMIWFYFYGHGREDNALITYQGGETWKRKPEALSIRELYKTLRASKAKRFVVILDGCYTGLSPRARSADKPFRFEKYPGMFLMAASGPRETAWQVKVSTPEGKRDVGLFTHSLCQAIRKGHTSFGSLENEVTALVLAGSRRQRALSVSPIGTEQRPVFDFVSSAALSREMALFQSPDNEGPDLPEVDVASPTSLIPAPAKVIVSVVSSKSQHDIELALTLQTKLEERLGNIEGVQILDRPGGVDLFSPNVADILSERCATYLVRAEVSARTEPYRDGIVTPVMVVNWAILCEDGRVYDNPKAAAEFTYRGNPVYKDNENYTKTIDEASQAIADRFQAKIGGLN